MTPDQIQIARVAMGLPGAPRWRLHSHPSGCVVRGGQLTLRDEAGVLWCRVPSEAGDREWLPDLTDAATGGALMYALGMDAALVCCVILRRDGGAPERAFATNRVPSSAGPHLAVACCHVALMVGRWLGGAP